jgi:hypothetical protein
LVPSLAKDNVALQYLILECGSETTFRRPFFNNLLNLTSDPTHSSNLGTLELGHLKFTVKHALHECRVFMNLEGFTYQLKFLHNLELRVQLNHYTGHTYSEVRHIFASNVVLEFLDTDESGAYCVGGAIEGCETEFGSIFYHAETV